MSVEKKAKWITQKQSRKFIKIAPIWNKMLKRGVFEDLRHYVHYFDIDNYLTCMTAEAHFFDGSYHNCKTCKKYSTLFFRYHKGNLNYPKRFRQILTKFLKHFEQKHKDLIPEGNKKC